MKNLIAASLALLVGYSQASCPNACSGHGTCGVDEVVCLMIPHLPYIALKFRFHFP